MATRRLQADFPAAEANRRTVGLVGGIQCKGHHAVCVQQIRVIVDQTVKAQIINRLVDVEKPQVGAVGIQRYRAYAAADIDVGVQIVHQLDNRES